MFLIYIAYVKLVYSDEISLEINVCTEGQN